MVQFRVLLTSELYMHFMRFIIEGLPDLHLVGQAMATMKQRIAEYASAFAKQKRLREVFCNANNNCVLYVFPIYIYI